MERSPESGRGVSRWFVTVFAVFGVVLVVVALDLLGVLNTLRGGFPLELTAYVQIVSALASVLLTFALVVLYRQQTQIQHRQEQWMEAEHVPDIFVHRWRVDGDEFVVFLSNLGTGVAQNVRVEVEIEPESSETPTLFGETRLKQTDRLASVVRANGDRVETSGTIGTVQSAEADDTETSQLSRLDVPCEADAVVRVSYEYVRRESNSKSVYAWTAKLTESPESLEDVVTAHREQTETALDVAPENVE